MLNKNKEITVVNRSSGICAYAIPEMNIVRQFTAGEPKDITIEEILALSYQAGGLALIKDCLLIKDEEVINYLFHKEAEPEYFYTEKEVRYLLENGTLEQLQDCLDFAPEGVIDMIKKISVEIRLNDMNKRQAIANKLGFDVTNALKILDAAKDEDEVVIKEEKTRRSAPINFENKQETVVRKSEPVKVPTYKVVGK